MDKGAEIARLNLTLELVSECAGLNDTYSVIRLIADRLRWVFDFEGCTLALRDAAGTRLLFMAPGDESLSVMSGQVQGPCRELALSALASGVPSGLGKPMTAIAHPLGDPNRPVGALCLKGGSAYAQRDLRFLHHVCLGLGAALVRIEQSSQISLQRMATVEAARSAEIERTIGERAIADNAAKDAFLAMLGHELRNPLAPIIASAELLRRELSGESLRRVLVIERQALQLERLVADLLDVSRIASGKIELRLSNIDLRSVAAKACEMVQPRMETRNQSLTLNLCDHPAMVHGDEARLAQVASNLLNNASGYSAPGSAVDMRVSVVGGEAILEVVDTGIGIAPEMLEGIFSMFVQGDRSAEMAPGGLGLGLSVAREIARMHEGRLWGESQGSGFGSRFVLALTSVGTTQAVEALEPGPAITAADGAALRILVVDDNVDAADAMGEILSLYGHEVRLAYAPSSALKVAADFRPQVAVLDIGLPEMDGYALGQALREFLGGGAPALVALSGYGQETDKARSSSQGFKAHLTKPVDLPELIAAVEAAASQ